MSGEAMKRADMKRSAWAAYLVLAAALAACGDNADGNHRPGTGAGGTVGDAGNGGGAGGSARGGFAVGSGGAGGSAGHAGGTGGVGGAGGTGGVGGVGGTGGRTCLPPEMTPPVCGW